MSSKSWKSDSTAISPELVTIGRIRKPHGVGGEVTVEVLSDTPDRFAVGAVVGIRLANGQLQTARIVSVRGTPGEAIVRFSGYDSRDQAEELRHGELQIDRCRVPEAPAGSFYFFDLIDCVCFDSRAGELGSVSRILADGGGLLLEVEKDNATLLVPFVEEYLVRVDIANRRIDLHLPEGLVETCTSPF